MNTLHYGKMSSQRFLIKKSVNGFLTSPHLPAFTRIFFGNVNNEKGYAVLKKTI